MEFFARRNGDNFHKRRSCRASSDKKGGAGSAAGSWWTLVTGGRRRGEKEGWKRSVQAEWRAWKKSSCRDGNETFNYVYLTGDDTRRSSRAFFFFLFLPGTILLPPPSVSRVLDSQLRRACVYTRGERCGRARRHFERRWIRFHPARWIASSLVRSWRSSKKSFMDLYISSARGG